MESGEAGMDHGTNQGEERVLRLRAVLLDLVRRKGRAGAARDVGLDPRTVDACLDGEGMSWRVREAVERAIQGEQGAEGAQQRENIRALERRVDLLEKAAESRTKGEGQGRADRQADSPPAIPGPAKPTAPAPPQPTGPERIGGGRRRYPELVFMEPAQDDEEVYGGAWPLVKEWREIWKAGHRGMGRSMDWLRTEERVRTLEVALLEEHGLTLPPEKMPLYGLDRRDQLVWRQKAIHDARKALAKAELRRRLTFGLWRS